MRVVTVVSERPLKGASPSTDSTTTGHRQVDWGSGKVKPITAGRSHVLIHVSSVKLVMSCEVRSVVFRHVSGPSCFVP